MTTPQRIQLSRKKGYRKPDGAIVVSRPSKWGNPYQFKAYSEDYPQADDRELRRMAVSDFRGMLEGRWDGPDHAPLYGVVDDVQRELRGHDLCCWCPLDQPCHVDVLLELANAEVTQ